MEQLNIFDILKEDYKIDESKPIRLISLFSGYDSQKLAFNYINKNVEHYRAIEFDKYAIQTLNEIHGTNFKTQDITKISANDLNIINTNKYTYILTYSFPCTDLSLAGKRAGMDRDSGTRSGLLWEVERLLLECKEKAQILIMENVPQVLSAKGWREWQVFLENLGYSNYAEILNSAHYGIPQHRERCFMVSILGDYNYKFPKRMKLKDRLRDFLENNVDEKYYLSDKMISYISSKGTKNYSNVDCRINLDIARPLTTDPNKRAGTSNYICEDLLDNFDLNKADELLLLCKNGELDGKEFPVGCDSTINNPKVRDISNCITGRYNAGIQNQQQIGMCVVEKTPRLVGGFGEKKSNDGKQWYKQDRIYDGNGVAMCHCANIPNGSYNYQLSDLRIRKLTPMECFKLMAVKPSDYNKITCSNAQKYKQAGNSIVTTCLMAIYSQLFNDCDYQFYVEELLKELRTN